MPKNKEIKTKPKYNGKHPGGRPPKFDSVELLENKINEYFNGGCKTKTIYVKVGKDEFEPQEMPIPTITGLALYLGFVNRASMYDYEDQPEFTNTIKRARAFMEQEYEEMLRFNPTGAIFALKNFGWRDKFEMEQYGKNGGPIKTETVDISNLTPAEKKAYITSITK